MRILYLSQYFPPEVGATQTRAYEMARGLVRAGHQVTILTELPNHPSGIIHPEYRSRLLVRRELEGIDVIHTWVKPAARKTLRTRLVFYLSYMLSAVIAGLLQARGRYDVIYATSPPLFVGGAALILSLLRRTPLVFEVRDLWPESAVALGELRNPRFIAWAEVLARACYRRSQHIVAVTAGVRQGIVDKGVDPAKISIIPNGANTALFAPDQQAAAEIRAQLGLENHFLLVYAGILGLAYSLETILDAADLLRERTDLTFLIIGAGPREAALRSRLGELDLASVKLLGEVPYASLPAYLAAADIALIPLRRLALFDGTLPVKMFDAWACGTATILAVDGGESQAAMEAAGGGYVVPPEDAAALAERIAILADDPQPLAAMGARGRHFVKAHYSREQQAEALAALLEKLPAR